MTVGEEEEGTVENRQVCVLTKKTTGCDCEVTEQEGKLQARDKGRAAKNFVLGCGLTRKV